MKIFIFFIQNKGISKFIITNYILIITFFLIILSYIYIFTYISNKISDLDEKYHQVQSDLNLHFNNSINKKIRIGIYTLSLSNGGVQRITSILINYLEKVSIFKIYLFNQKGKEKDEYKISDDIKRVIIKDSNNAKELVRKIKKNKIDVFIYQFPKYKEIKELNNLKIAKVVFYIHSCFLYWLYARYYNVFKIYKEYKNSKYIISITPIENNYLFKKWGINSVLFENFLTYNYYSTIVSNLSSKKILLIGRGNSKLKRFELGIQAMEYLKNEYPFIILNIISKYDYIDDLHFFIHNLNLENNIKFVNYSSDPSIYFKDASLNFLTSVSESFSLVLSETKIYGIPNILLGLDYVLLSNNGTYIIYDDLPETLAEVSKKILFHNIYKEKLSREARVSMKKYNNDNIFMKWKLLLLLVYNNIKNYNKFFEDTMFNNDELYTILKRQVILLKNRIEIYKNITVKDLENLPFMNFAKYAIKETYIE
jgi:hypothetical protein